MARSFISIVLGYWMAISPLFAHGQTASANELYAKAFDKFFKDAPIVSKTSYHNDYIEVEGRDAKSNKVSFQIKRSSEAELREFDPEVLNKKLAAELKNKVTSWQALKSATKRFPLEAGMFFVAIGAVTALQIFTEYSSNPTRMEQHITHSLSPVGALSFWAFVAANGVTSNALMTILKNPKYHMMIPNFGMTAGYFASSTLSVFAADPNVKACVKVMMGQKIDPQASAEQGIAENPCKEAFSWYSLKGKAYELTPGLISMLASNYITIKAQQLLVKGMLRYFAMDITFLFMPGGVGVKGISFVISNMVQMGVFYYLDVAWFNHFFTFNFKNIYDGRYIAKLDRKITSGIIRQKSFTWNDPGQQVLCLSSDRACRQKYKESTGREYDTTLSGDLKELQTALANWRMTNLAKVYEAHMGWQQLLARFNNQYDTAEMFYQDLVNEVLNVKLNLTENPYLNRVDPLFGIKGQNLTDEAIGDYYLRPAFTDNEASASARKIGQDIVRKIHQGAYDESRFSPMDLSVLLKIGQKLSSTDYAVQGEGVSLLNQTYSKFLASSTAYTDELRTALVGISQSLGWSPQPLMTPGHGFFSRYEKWSLGADALKTVKYPQVSGYFETRRAVDYLAVQSVCGPDLDNNESVVQVRFGGSADFIPPRLVNGTQSVCAPSMGQPWSSNQIYSFRPDGSNSPVNRGVVDVLIKNLKPALATNEIPSGLSQYWSQKVEGQVLARYKEFEKEYQKIMVMLVSALNRKDDASSNEGPAPSGVIASMRQQMRLNLVVLGEIFKDLSKRDVHPSRQSYFVSKPEPPPIPWRTNSGRARMEQYWKDYAQKQSPVPLKQENPGESLLSALRADMDVRTKYGFRGANKQSPSQTSVFDFARLATTFTLETGASPNASHALRIQKEIEYIFEKLFWLIQSIKVQKVAKESAGTESAAQRISRAMRSKEQSSQDADERIQAAFDYEIRSTFENAELEELIEQLSQKTTEFSSYFGINDSPIAASGEKLLSVPNMEVQNLVSTALEDLLSIGQEAYMYGSILNAVSWEKRNSSKAKNDTQKAFEEKAQQEAKRLGGGGMKPRGP